MRFHHVGLTVADLDRAVAWYCRALGFAPGYAFTLEELDLRGRFVAAPNGICLELMERPGSRPGPDLSTPEASLAIHGYGHVCLEVDDVDTAFAAVVAHGAVPAWDPRPAPAPGSRMAFVTDPDGNLIELIGPATAAHPSSAAPARTGSAHPVPTPPAD